MRDAQNIDRARRLRGGSNLAERQAWRQLRQLRREGWPVRRQHPIDNMIVDFAVTTARLVIEIDGTNHARNSVVANDAERDARLRALGWRVLRLSSEMALSNQTLILVRRAIASPGPSPVAAAPRHPLPQAGEG